MRRRRFAIVGLLTGVVLVASGAGPAVSGPEKLAMPYGCAKSGDRVSVSPSAIQGLEVVGARSSQTVELCETQRWRDRGGACVPVEVHRFDVLCGDRRVAWSDVAGAIARHGKLKLIVNLTSGAKARTVSCQVEPDERGKDRVPHPAGGALALACRDTFEGGAATRIPLPAGFAPIGEAAWLEPVVALAPDTVRSSSGAGIVEVTSADLPDITPPEPKRISLDQWIDTSEIDRDGGAIDAALAIALPQSAAEGAPSDGGVVAATLVSLADGQGATAGPLAPLAMAMLLSTALALMAVRARRERVRAATGMRSGARRQIGWSLMARIAGSAGREGQDDAFGRARALERWRGLASPEAVNAVTSIAESIDAVRAQLAGLKNSGPLIDVLSGELDALSARLEALATGVINGEDAAQRAAPAFRNLVRELERVRRIIDSARLSMGAAGERDGAHRIPATRAEAYALLGLNPDAPDGTLKKVADGLRMGWHPDHARDEDDRRAREERVKAINTAVDLISGKRSAA